MIRQRLRGFALALGAGAAIATVQAAERDVVGWERARWGMSESEIKEAFKSKLMVPLAGEQPGETMLSIPGYVFLGCPFDVSFRFAGFRASSDRPHSSGKFYRPLRQRHEQLRGCVQARESSA